MKCCPVKCGKLALKVKLVHMNVPFIVVTLLMLAPGAVAPKIVLLLQRKLASRHVLHALVNVRNCQLVAFLDGSARYYEHSAASKNGYTIRPTAMIDQVGWPIESSASA